MKVSDFAAAYLDELRAGLESLELVDLERIVEVLDRARRQGRTVFVVGNGGSAATAAHIASDLSRVTAGTDRGGLRALSLTDNVAAFTAMANDTCYEDAFAEMLSIQAGQDDVVIAISGSGSSENVLRAVEAGRRRGATTIGLVGFGGGELGERVDLRLCLASRHYGVVEDLHLALGHMIAMYLAGGERIEHPDRRPGSSLERAG